MTALAKAPDDRFPTAEALAAALVPFASAEGTSGPYSMRPSQHAFEIANQAMARAPVGRRATSSTELYRLPPSRVTPRLARRPSRWDTVRALAATIALGAGLATALSLVPRAAHTTAAARSSAARDAVPAPFPSDSLPDAAVTAKLTTTRPPDTAATSSAFPPPPSSVPAPPAARRRSTDLPHARIERPLYL
jgi:hypothetical protein